MLAVHELGAELKRKIQRFVADRMDAPTDAIARLDDCHAQSGGSEVARGGETSGAGANNQN